MKTKNVLPFAVLLLVSACAVKVTPENAGPYPDNYKEIMKSYVQKDFFDPYSMRDVAISTPTMGQMMFQPGWLVCLQANAKNRMGGYVGTRKTAYLIKNGAIADALDNAPVCDQIALEPWPEMENSGSAKR